MDAVIELRGRAIPIEIKWTPNPKPTDATHVERFMEIHRDLTDKGYIICRCPHPQQLTDWIMAVPWEYI